MRQIFCFVFLVWGALCAQQTFVNEELSQEDLGRILSHNMEAVLYVTHGKAYLDPSRIIPSEQGMLFLQNDLSTVVLPEVCSDAGGCYVKCDSFCLIALDLGQCNYCSFKYPEGRFSICPRCLLP